MTTWRPSTRATTPRPGAASKSCGSTRGMPSLRAASTMASPRACSDARSAEAARRRTCFAIACGDDVRDGGRPAGDRAGLVQDHRRHPVSLLQGLRAANEHAVLGALPNAHHDGGGRGEAQGAGTGDDEDGHKGEERVGEGGLRPQHKPEEEGEGGDGDDGRHEVGGNPVDQPLDGGAGALGGLDQADDLGEDGVPAHLGGLEGEAAGAVQGCPEDPGARSLLHGHALAGEGGLVEGGGARGHNAVDGELLAGAHQHQVARHDLRDGHVHSVAVPQDARSLRLEAHEGADGLGGASLGPGLQEASEEDEGDDEGGGVEVDAGLHAAFGKEVGEEGDGDAEEVGRAGAQDDEGVHGGGAVSQGAQAGDVELPARPELHGRGQGPEDVPVLQEGGDPGEEVRHAAEQDRNAQETCDGETPLQGADLRCAGQSLDLGLRALLRLRAGGVACIDDGGAKVVEGGGARQELDLGLLGGQVDGDALHPRHALDGALDVHDAGGAGHAPDDERGLLHRRRLRHCLFLTSPAMRPGRGLFIGSPGCRARRAPGGPPARARP